MSDHPRPRPGRPRSATTRRAILEAAVDELRDKGYAGVTIDGIASRAGASRQTIYRWWSSKAEVVLEALLDFAASRIVAADRGSLGEDLRSFLRMTFRQQSQEPVLRGLMAEALLDPAFAVQFRERFLFGRREALRTVLTRAVQRGEIDTVVDLELVIDVVYGVLWYRVLVGHTPLSERGGRELADFIERALRR